MGTRRTATLATCVRYVSRRRSSFNVFAGLEGTYAVPLTGPGDLQQLRDATSTKAPSAPTRLRPGRWRFVFRQSDGSLTARGAFESRGAAASLPVALQSRVPGVNEPAGSAAGDASAVNSEGLRSQSRGVLVRG